MLDIFTNPFRKNDKPALSVYELPAEAQLEIQKEAEQLPFQSLRETSAFSTDEETHDTIQSTPLHKAAALGDIRAVQDLLSRGADINAMDAMGRYPLQVAQGTAVRELLVEEGWRRDSNAIFVAIENYQNDRLDWLLSKGLANPRKVGSGQYEGNLPLFNATMLGNVDAISLLTRHSVQPNDANRQGELPLLWAARANQIPAMRALLEAGADPNKEGDRRKTRAIHLASMRSLPLLLEFGADVSLKDSQGRDALDRAKDNHRPEVVDALLKEMGA